MKRGERGFTLIELMLTLAVSSIVMAFISQVIFMSTRSFQEQLDRSESQQNARAVVSLMKRYVRLAGWGMSNDVLATGNAALGACYATGNPEQEAQDCDAIDLDSDSLAGHPNGMDRLRASYIIAQGGGAVMRQPFAIVAAGPPNEILDIPMADILLPDPGAPHPYIGSPIGIISGPCTGGGFGSDVIEFVSNTGSNGAVFYSYDFNRIQDGANNLVSCPGGMDANFTVGTAVVADFWVNRVAVPETPTLMVRFDPRQPLASGFTVAFDIDDLQVSYLLDVSCFDDPFTGADECGGDPLLPDLVWDVECDNLDPAFTDVAKGYCNHANMVGMSWAERLARVTGVRVAIVARTREYVERWDNSPNYIWTQNHRYFGDDDGYKRWIYRATLALRNNEL